MLRAVILILVQVPLIAGQVELKTLVNRTVSSIECISKSNNIQFHFKNETSNNARLIAECAVPKPGCYLVDATLGKYYTVSFTGEGGLLIIIRDDFKTRGQYTCCETFKDASCESTEIGYPTKSTSQVNADRAIYVQNNFFGGANITESKRDTINVHASDPNVHSSVLIAAIVAPCVTIVVIVSILAGVYTNIRIHKQQTTLPYSGRSFQEDAKNRLPVSADKPELPSSTRVNEDSRQYASLVQPEEHPLAEDDHKTSDLNLEIHTSTKHTDDESSSTAIQSLTDLYDGCFAERETSLKGRTQLHVPVDIHEEKSNDLHMQDIQAAKQTLKVVDGENSPTEHTPLLPMSATDDNRYMSSDLDAEETDTYI